MPGEGENVSEQRGREERATHPVDEVLPTDGGLRVAARDDDICSDPRCR